MKKISYCEYLVKSTTGKYIQIIVDFNRHKLCEPCMRFQHILSDDGELRSKADLANQSATQAHLLGKNLELVDTDEMATTKLNRVLQPTSCFTDFVSH